MFTKFKSAVASLWARIITRMYEMSIEQEAATALKVAVADVEEVVAKVESLIEPAAAVAQAVVVASGSGGSGASDSVVAAGGGSTGAAIVPAAAVSVATIVAKVKAVLSIVDTVPASFDTYAAPVIKAAGTDIDAALTMFEKILDLAGVKSPFWAEVVAAAKAL